MRVDGQNENESTTGETVRTAPMTFHPELSASRRWAVLVSFVWASAISIMSQLTMTTCLPSILTEFDVSTEHGQWLTTSYMLSLGIMVPCSGFFTTRFQSRHIFLGANLVFLVGLLGAFAPNFQALVAVRFVQGLAAGLFIPLMQIVAFRLFPPDRRGFAMGVVAIALAAGPTMGPLVAGICTDLWGWRAVFLGVGLLTLSSIASYPVMRVLSDPTQRCTFDMPSLAMLAVSFIGLLFGVSNLGVFARDMAQGLVESGLPLAVGVVALAFFVRRQNRLAQPLLNLAPFRDRRFVMGSAAVMLIFGVLINTEVFMSVYIQSDQGFSPTVAALTLLPGSVISASLCPFTGRVLDKHGPLGLAIVGFSVLVVAGTLASLVELSSPLGYSVLAFSLRSFGNGFVLQNMQTWACNVLPDRLMTHGTAITNTMRQMGGGLINASLFALMGAATPVLGQMGGIKLAFAVSTVAIALMGAWLIVSLAREKRGAAR